MAAGITEGSPVRLSGNSFEINTLAESESDSFETPQGSYFTAVLGKIQDIVGRNRTFIQEQYPKMVEVAERSRSFKIINCEGSVEPEQNGRYTVTAGGKKIFGEMNDGTFWSAGDLEPVSEDPIEGFERALPVQHKTVKERSKEGFERALPAKQQTVKGRSKEGVERAFPVNHQTVKERSKEDVELAIYREQTNPLSERRLEKKYSLSTYSQPGLDDKKREDSEISLPSHSQFMREERLKYRQKALDAVSNGKCCTIM